MTLTDFEAFKAEAEARGFSHVLTAAGPATLARWHPCGAFGGGNDAFARVMTLCWVRQDTASDTTPELEAQGWYGHHWTFLDAATAARMEEAEHTGKRRRA